MTRLKTFDILMPDTVEQSDAAVDNEAVEPEVTTPTDEGAPGSEESIETNSSDEITSEEPATSAGRVSGLKGLPWKWVSTGVGLVLILFAGYWFLTREAEITPADKLKQALTLLEERDNPESQKQAKRLAYELIKLKYRDPHFVGGPEYIIGMIHFREAQFVDEGERDSHLLPASKFLRDAEHRAINTAHHAEWAYAMGVSLFHIGKATEARPLLEETVKNNPAHQIETSMLLINVYLDLQVPDLYEQALTLSNQVLASEELSQTDRDQTYLQRARILLLFNRQDEVKQTLAKVSSNAVNNQETVVLKARTLMLEKKYQDAYQLLKPIANGVGLEQTTTRKAAFFQGLCAEKLGDSDAAINLLARAAKKYFDSHEGVAASLSAGDLLRTVRRDEEALQMYRQALKQVTNRDDFRNRWITADQFRQRIQQAWDSWIGRKEYNKAIELSKLMPPLFTKAQAFELVAIANQNWAESIEQELSNGGFKEQVSRKEELHERWFRCGEAYARLAVELRTTTRYPDALWKSASHHQKGHHFEHARKQYVSLINTRPKKRIAIAYVKLGQTLMDLDQLDEAITMLEQVQVNYPTNAVVYEAGYLLGLCHLEKGDLKKAGLAWRSILTSSELTPAANEWRLSLFALGRLLHHSASMKFSQAKSQLNATVSTNKTATISPELQKLFNESFNQWEEASLRLEEYLDRYPQSEQANEARFLLAKTAQYNAELPRRKLKTAETENAQKETLRNMRALLSQAKDEFLKLQIILLEQSEKNRLNDLEERLLHDCYFELAHTYYALKAYDKAVIRYSGAVNRYPRDPQVLLSYLQMANCYENINKPLEARSMFEQAKVILDGMDENVFDPKQTSMTKEEWINWLTVMRKLHLKRY